MKCGCVTSLSLWQSHRCRLVADHNLENLRAAILQATAVTQAASAQEASRQRAILHVPASARRL